MPSDSRIVNTQFSNVQKHFFISITNNINYISGYLVITQKFHNTSKAPQTTMLFCYTNE